MKTTLLFLIVLFLSLNFTVLAKKKTHKSRKSHKISTESSKIENNEKVCAGGECFTPNL
jgi:hypothetical protein